MTGKESREPEWPWWQAGILLGLLNAATFYVSNYFLSTSTTFSRAAGMRVGLVAPDHVAGNAYWAKIKPVVDWQFMLVIGLFLGAFLAAKLSGTFRMSLVPRLFAARFGGGAARRWGVGLLGGVTGLLIGAGLYSELYPSLLPGFQKIGDFGNATLPQVLGLGVWTTISIVAAFLALAIWLLDHIDRGAQVKIEPLGCSAAASADPVA